LRVVYRRRALADLEQIHSFIAKENPVAARRVVERIGQALRRLESFPYSGRPGEKSGPRELSVTGLPYLAIYRLVDVESESFAEIVAIYHTARNRRPEDY
jgi:plasmid stabilization system protein ParE